LVRELVLHGEATYPELKDVLANIANAPISPELTPPEPDGTAQQTESLVGPYELHDFFLYYTLRWGFSPHKVLRYAVQAFDERYTEDDLLKWMRVFYSRFFSQQFKRSCLPDGAGIGSVSLSPRGAFNMPSDASASAWLEELENIIAEKE
jgi:NAD+ synthase (glutamine-hydrolysing)